MPTYKAPVKDYKFLMHNVFDLQQYEELEMWEEAEMVKKKMNEDVTGAVHIDADDLFHQIKKKGSIIPYKCPYCLGRIRIDGSERIDECPYCGTGLDLKSLSSLVGRSLE